MSEEDLDTNTIIAPVVMNEQEGFLVMLYIRKILRNYF